MDGTILAKDVSEVRRSKGHGKNLRKDERIRKEKRMSRKRGRKRTGLYFHRTQRSKELQESKDGSTSISKWQRPPKCSGMKRCPLDLALGMNGKVIEFSREERLDFLRGNVGEKFPP